MTSTKEAVDVVELCALLQCLGFNVKSLEIKDENVNPDNATRTIAISCQSSRLEVVMESVDSTCSCPTDAKKDNSGFWQVSGVTGGKHQITESGCKLIGYIPKMYQEKITKELQVIIEGIRNCKLDEKSNEGNRSTSMLELSAPEMRLQLKEDTPTRYRSLDTLITSEDGSEVLSIPDCLKNQIVKSLKRQCTYTMFSTPNTSGNKTSSPIQRLKVPKNVLEKLNETAKHAERVIKIISEIIQNLTEDTENDSSCLGLDVSKISVIKVSDTPKGHSFSSPNIPSLLKPSDNESNLKRSESSASAQGEKGLPSRLRRLSPLIKSKKDTDETSKVDKKPKDSKFTSLFKPKAVAGTGTSTSKSDFNRPNISASKNKYSHIKSSIPKPSAKPKD